MLINGKQVADIAEAMNMDMSNVLNMGSLATVARSADGGKRKQSSRAGWRHCRRKISFLHTEAVKVSLKPVIKCIMCHIPVSHVLRDWNADVRLRGLTTLSCSSLCLLGLMASFVPWPRGEMLPNISPVRASETRCSTFELH